MGGARCAVESLPSLCYHQGPSVRGIGHGGPGNPLVRRRLGKGRRCVALGDCTMPGRDLGGRPLGSRCAPDAHALWRGFDSGASAAARVGTLPSSEHVRRLFGGVGWYPFCEMANGAGGMGTGRSGCGLAPGGNPGHDDLLRMARCRSAVNRDGSPYHAAAGWAFVRSEKAARPGHSRGRGRRSLHDDTGGPPPSDGD